MTKALFLPPPRDCLSYNNHTRIFCKVDQAAAIAKGVNAPAYVTIFVDVAKLSDEGRQVLIENLTDEWLASYNSLGELVFHPIYPAKESGFHVWLGRAFSAREELRRQKAAEAKAEENRLKELIKKYASALRQYGRNPEAFFTVQHNEPPFGFTVVPNTEIPTEVLHAAGVFHSFNTMLFDIHNRVAKDASDRALAGKKAAAAKAKALDAQRAEFVKKKGGVFAERVAAGFATNAEIDDLIVIDALRALNLASVALDHSGSDCVPVPYTGRISDHAYLKIMTIATKLPKQHTLSLVTFRGNPLKVYALASFDIGALRASTSFDTGYFVE